MNLLWLSSSDDQIVELADWVEVSTLFREDKSVSRQDLVRALCREQSISDHVAEKIAEEVFIELQDRQKSCGKNPSTSAAFYPFKLDSPGDLLKRQENRLNPEAETMYLFLLTITRADMSSSKR